MLDISYHAVDVLKQCDLIACEDTRTSKKIFQKYGIDTKLVPYHDKNEQAMANWLSEQVSNGLNVAVVSDAGTPTISDPGFRIVRACRKLHLPVLPIPGPSAMIAALSVSGLPSNTFLFLGFPGHKSSARIKLLSEYMHHEHTIIFYESCYRVEKFLTEIAQIYPEHRVISIAKEITKLHEQYFTGTISEAKVWMENISIKGEFVVLIAPESFVL